VWIPARRRAQSRVVEPQNRGFHADAEEVEDARGSRTASGAVGTGDTWIAIDGG